MEIAHPKQCTALRAVLSHKHVLSLPAGHNKTYVPSQPRQVAPRAHPAPISAAATVTEHPQQQGTAGSLQVQQPAAPRVTGNTVVLTGGSQGVGRATALLFARNGYNVVIAARNPDKLRAADADISTAASSADAHMALATDITDEAAVQQLVDAVTAKYKTVTTLINCAGVCLNGSLADTSLSDFTDQINVNFLGAVAVTKGFQPALERAARSGAKPVIVNVNSFGGRIPLRNMAAYTASKFALAGFTDAIRPELAELGIHVAHVHPGVVNSNFMERAVYRGAKGDQERSTVEQMLASPPVPGLVQTPEEVAEQIYAAVVGRKDEVFVGVYKAIHVLYRSTGVNPFSVAR